MITLMLLYVFSWSLKSYSYKSLKLNGAGICKSSKCFSSIPELYNNKLNLSIHQIKLIDELRDQLVQWNLNVNLISRKDIDAIIPNHILPSLSINVVRSFKKGERVIDVGTGGGLPGLPLAIVNPDAYFTLMDSNSKKMKVVQNIVDTLKLTNVQVICSRAEDHKEKYDFILGRAVSAIPNFLSYSSHLLSSDRFNTTSTASDITSTTTDKNTLLPSGLLYLKGGDFTEELLAAEINPTSVTMFPVTELIPGLPSEKFVLYIPSSEIIQFHHRQIIVKAKLLANQKEAKKK